MLLAAGIALVLAAASPWGANARPGRRATAWLVVLALTAGAIGLTWVTARFVPTFEPRSASEPLQMSDPSLDLKRNLVPAAALGMTTVWIANDAPWSHGGPPMPDDGEDHVHHVAEAVAAFLHSIETGDPA